MSQVPSEEVALAPPANPADPPANPADDDVSCHHTGTSIYLEGEYLAQNPSWHVEDSPRKAEHILRLIRRNRLAPRTVCEVGCGAGEILLQLKRNLPDDCEFWGYDISPQAHALAATREDDRLHFQLGDLTEQRDDCVDLILVIDLLEHLEDYYGLLRNLQPRSVYKIFHIPLDLSAYTVARDYPILELRRTVGHIHYFTLGTALAALRDTGYQTIDWFYLADNQPLKGKPLRRRILALLRKLLFRLSPDFAVRVLGGHSLMVLAR